MFCTQLIGLVLASGWVVGGAQPLPPLMTLAAGAGAGLGLTLFLAAFLQAAIIGSISIVAPISAVGVAIPIFAGLVDGERLSLAQAIGIFAAVTGVVLAARSKSKVSLHSYEPGFGLALLAALGGGLLFWLMEPATRHGVAWAILLTRAVPVSILVATHKVHHASLRQALDWRTAVAICAVALLGFSSLTLYAFATRHGQLGIVSVLSSMYPAITVLLAFAILHERVSRIQQVGIATALVGVVLLSVR